MRIIIADDEPAALASLEILLSTESDVELVAKCTNGTEAAEAILVHEPDLVFLDIQMPEMDGFEVLRSLAHEYQCSYIFVTAYDHYAIEAFNCSAVDYLLKPYDDERFFKSLQKARQAVLSRNTSKSFLSAGQLISLIRGNYADQSAYAKKLISKTRGTMQIIPVKEIKYIEAQGNFVLLHTIHNEVKTGNYTFKKLLEILDPLQFVQIHRSFIVCTDLVASVEPYFNSDYTLILKDKEHTRLRLSRNFKSSLDAILN